MDVDDVQAPEGDLLDVQLALMGVLSRFTDDVTTTPLAQWTPGLARARLQTIERYWTDFQANHLDLIRLPREGNEYNQDNYATTERMYIQALSHLYDTLDRLTPTPAAAEMVQAPARAGPSIGVRLPQINIPIFSGRREDWEPFRDMFKALIHDEEQWSDVQRLFYLKSHVEGDAKAALDTIQVSGSNYPTAWALLEARYEHRRLLVQDHLRALRNIKPLRDETSGGVRGLLDQMERHRDQLKALGRPVESWDDWFVSIATSAMDPTTRRAWEDELDRLDAATPDQQPEPASFKTLTTFLQRRCRSLASVEVTVQPRAYERPPARQPNFRAFRTLATSTAPTSCACCSASH